MTLQQSHLFLDDLETTGTVSAAADGSAVVQRKVVGFSSKIHHLLVVVVGCEMSEVVSAPDCSRSSSVELRKEVQFVLSSQLGSSSSVDRAGRRSRGCKCRTRRISAQRHVSSTACW